MHSRVGHVWVSRCVQVPEPFHWPTVQPDDILGFLLRVPAGSQLREPPPRKPAPKAHKPEAIRPLLLLFENRLPQWATR